MRARVTGIGWKVTLLGAGLAFALSACDARPPREPLPAGAKAKPSSPHRAATAAPQCAGPDVHQRHLAQFACETCHPTGGAFGFTVPYVFPKGTTTAGGTLAKGSGTTPTHCTVACHFPMGGTAKSVAWNAQAPLACTACHATTSLPAEHPVVAANATRADCQACHATTGHLGGTVAFVGHAPAWNDPASSGFHAHTANQGLAPCQGCHAPDLGGGATGVSCGSCHDLNLPAGVASWRQNCVMCHGGTDNQTGAPPKATWGNAGDAIRVGAHTAHGTASALAPAFDCNVCHVKPADALAGGHIDAATAEVRFAGIAVNGANITPAWDRVTATCSNTYCHGATLGGGTNKAPVWTQPGQAGCGTCHGLPPPSPHAAVADLTGCVGCHPQTMNATGALIAPSAGGKHLDGLVESSGTHEAGWMDTASATFHAYAANRGLGSCQGCHGTALDGVGGMTAVSCGQCHDRSLPPGVTSWKANCTMCHGDDVGFTNGAPPRTTWGNGVPADTTNIRIGAHQSHLRAADGLAAPLDCTACHAKPADALASAHVDGVATVTGYTGTDPNLLATVKDPSFSAATSTCATSYCHGGGGKLTDGKLTQPKWTQVDGTQGACGTCHGVPPYSVWGHAYHRDCQRCHFDVATWDPAKNSATITNPALHVNGVVELLDGLKEGWVDWTKLPPDCSACHSY